ncbi:MAG: hydrogenase expression/formation protein HypE [Kiritimatiellae bacterium]|nr:hydrogenase expression/formation protein HypE [Kiritimatiellia bacterium]MDD5523170.1 hydrogenase expression/formation protein HypE [Kiritimatiellia bacterium]
MNSDTTIQLAHGGGGRLSRDLINAEIVSRFGQGPLEGLPDAATLPWNSKKMIFTTDSFVVQPLEFPGGNIGDLAVYGTVNDISVCGGTPKWLSMGLIIEEGLSISTLRHILDSIKTAASACGVVIATGDTKVVGRGQCDGLFVNTSGIGEAIDGFNLNQARIAEGDEVIASGNLADHGFAVLAARQNINIGSTLKSDTAPVHRLVEAVQEYACEVKFMRDPTRGGLASVLNEVVENRNIGICLDETDLPFSTGTKALSEMLGIDPLHVASEGRIVMICSHLITEKILTRWRNMPEGTGAMKIGTVINDKNRVTIKTITGGKRIVDVPRGELLPRIC